MNMFQALIQESIPSDKAYHIVAGVAVFAITNVVVGALWAAYAVVLIALMKEAYDYTTGKGTPELADFLYTLIGGGLCLASRL